MIRRLPYIHLLCMTFVLCAALAPGVARAQLTVTPTVQFDGALYHYDYTVANITTTDLAIVSVNVAPSPDAVMNPTAPSGFQTIFDPGVGLVSFLEDSDPATLQTFGAGLSVSGFRFDSALPALATSFEALDITGTTLTGSTQGPIGPDGVIPEPSTLALLGAFAIPVGLRRGWRARRSVRPSPNAPEA